MSGLKCLHLGQEVLKAMNTTVDDQPVSFDEPARKRQRLWEDGVMENGHCNLESNGNSPNVASVGRHKRFDRAELVRLMIQQLHELGYSGVAAELESVSGHKLELHEITILRQAVNAGEWATARSAIATLPVDEETMRKAEFLVLETKFVEVRLLPCVWNPSSASAGIVPSNRPRLGDGAKGWEL